MQVLRHPAEARRKIRAQPFMIVLHRAGRWPEIRNLAAPDQIRKGSEHDRGLDIAAVNAVRALGLAEQSLRIAEAVPRAMYREHLMPHAQLPCRKIDDAEIATMAVDDDELPDPRAIDARADLDERAQRGFRRQGERAGKGLVLVRGTDGLHGQHYGRRTFRQQRAYARQIGLRDIGIDS